MAFATPAPPAPMSPVTVECVLEAARSQHVPLSGLIAILAAEGGRVGQSVRNANGTRDLGPAQVNSSWLAPLAAHHISETLLRNNGCVNVLTGAWILRGALLETHGDLWAAMGRYHSPRGELARDYQRRIYRLLRSSMNVRQVVDNANRGLGDHSGPESDG